MAPAAAPLELHRLSKRYGKERGVADISLRVEAGEVFGLLGSTGAGKTTIIHLVAGLLRPTSGSARIFGKDSWPGPTRQRRDLAFAPALVGLPERMDLLEFLLYMAKLHRGVRKGRIEGLADRFELHLRTPIRHLSAAGRRKVALIQALMHEAPLLVLDQPLSDLERPDDVTLLNLLREEKKAGHTVLISSSRLGDMERICDRVAILRGGLLAAVEDVESLKTRRFREVLVTFRSPVDPRGFEIDGVTVLERSERRFRLGVRGEVNTLIRTLARHDVADVHFAEPDLAAVSVNSEQAGHG
jgi:ABC-2 type transport system ATP-binding protein